MKNKIIKYLLITVLIIFTIIFSFYIYLGYQFGKASSKAIESVIVIKNQWEKDKINPLDSIAKNLNKILDSTNYNK